MRKRTVTGFALLLAVSLMAVTVVRAGRAQGVATGKARVLEAVTASLGYEIIKVGPVIVGPNQQFFQLLQCPAGKKVVGGGFSSGSDFWRVISSDPLSATVWEVKGLHDAKTGTSSVSAYAICMIVP